MTDNSGFFNTPSACCGVVYFFTESNQANVLKVSDRVATGIKYALDVAGIDMPYPHTVVLFQDNTAASNDGNAERAMRRAARKEINQ